MCAINGIVNFDRRPVEAAELVAMRDAMFNRGPEHGGQWIAGYVGLGHRRLRIIDLSELGNQPMTNEDSTVWVVLNGEIYNFRALRKDLEEGGHIFRSQSDTEVIVHGYEEWGQSIFAHLDGMYAIGIWDTREQALLLGVDRFGKKPLFYSHHGASVRFASDSKAFWAVPGSVLTVDHSAIDCYLHHLGVTGDHSIYRELKKVLPSHYMVFTKDGSRSVRYWQPRFTNKLRIGETEALERIEHVLREAVRKRMIADVPLGAFLSGGVDSSVVVALMSQLSNTPVKTFSIGFEEQDFSELAYSDAVAERYHTDHQRIVLKPDLLTILPSLVWEYGEPFADSSAVPTYYVSKAAKEFVTVALTGDGGDEMFGGYDIARASFYAMLYDRFLPGVLRKPLEHLLFGAGGKGMLQGVRTLATHASADPARRHGYSMAFDQGQRERLYTKEFQLSLGGHRPEHIYERHAPEMARLSLVDQNLYHVLMARLPNDYLVKVDVASMKVALELRSPFLDTALCDLTSSLEPRLKIKGGKQKYLLKRLAERFLPWEVIYRPKRGFSLPLKHWLRKEFAPLLRRMLPAGNLVKAGWLRRVEIERLLVTHASGQEDHTHRIWALLWLELWHRIFVERSMSGSETLSE